MFKTVRAIFVSLALCLAYIPSPALADYPLVTSSGTLTAINQQVLASPLTGQSSCAVEVVSDAGLTLSFEGIVNTTWVAVPGVTPDQATTASTVTGPGTYIVNCASLIAFRVRVSAGAGSAVVNVTASGGVGRTLSSGVNGGRTNVVGSGPITVTNSGNTATVGCTGCGAGPSPTPVSVQAGTGIAVATPSPGVFVVSNTETPSPTSTPVSVTGTGIAVATNPTPGVYNIFVPSPAPVATASPVTVTSGSSNVTVATPTAGSYVVSVTSGVTAVTGSGNMQVSAGPTPNVTITNSPTFTGTSTFGVAHTNSGGNSLHLENNSAVSGAQGLTALGSGIPVNGVGGNTGTSSGVGYTCLALSDLGAITFAAFDCAGNLGLTGAIYPALGVFTPSVTDSGLTPGDCVQAGTGGILTSAASACGSGGGVTAVTATSPIVSSGGTTPAISCPSCLTGVTAGSNITVGAGPSPSVSITSSPAFSGYVTAPEYLAETNGGTLGVSFYANNTYSGGIANNPYAFFVNGDFTGPLLNTVFGTDSTSTVNTVVGSLLSVKQYNSNTNSVQTNPFNLDPAGNVGLAGSLHATNLYASTLTAGQCVQTTTGGELATTGSACGSGGGGATPAPHFVANSNSIGLSLLNSDITSPRLPSDGSQVNAEFPNAQTLTGLYVSCVPYQPTDSQTPYSDGNISGATITFYDYSPTTSTSIGSVLINSYTGTGPYISYGSTTLGTPYSVPAGDWIAFEVSGTDGSTDNQWGNCNFFVVY